MNTKNLSSAELKNALESKLEEMLRGIEWLRGWKVVHAGGAPYAGYDFLARVPLPAGGVAVLCVICKRELHPSAFLTIAGKTFSPTGSPRVVVPVLALPWVSPRMAELCGKHGWSWLDLAGNYSLDIRGLLHLRNTGNEPVHERSRPTANLSTPEAGQVIRALLLPEHSGHRWRQREIQEECEPKVSLGLVNKVVRYLRDEAFVETDEDGRLRLRDPQKLLFAWRDAYRFERHQRRGYFTLLREKALRDALAGLGMAPGGKAAYAAFSAAEFQAPHVRQPKIWLYLSPSLEDEFRSRAEAKPVDSGENIVVLFPGDHGVFYASDGAMMSDNRLACTNVVQTYVDLFHCGGRGEEAAEALLNQKIKPDWKAHGLQV